MLGDLVASADPDPVVAQAVVDETGKCSGARRLAGETAMCDGHHLRCLLALAVERVEIVAQLDEEILSLTPAQATREARIVVIERMRNDEMVAVRNRRSNREVRRCMRRCHKGTRLPQEQGAVYWRPACRCTGQSAAFRSIAE